MKVKQIFDLAIKLGIQNDLRGRAAVKRYLDRQKKLYEKLSKKEKNFFDKQRLENPFSDCQILHDNGKEVKKILAGIDIGPAELLLAKEIDVDMVFSHHPHGSALANLPAVMDLQIEVLANYGVPVNIAEGLFKVKMSEVSRSVTKGNYNRAPDTAELLDMNFACLHTACDNLVASFLNKKISEKKFEFVGDLMEFLDTIPEYERAKKIGAGPRLFAGDKKNRCGKIALTEITGGTEGHPEIYEKFALAEIGTIIGMHLSEKHKEQAEKNHINAIVAGHMSSDSIGVNLFLDELEKKGIEIIPCSGLIRISRNKK